VITATARALATAVLDGDELAADALVDYMLENRNHGGRDVAGYIDKCEDCVRELKRIVHTAAVPLPLRCKVEGSDEVVGYRVLSAKDFDAVYQLCFNLERDARLLGRSGCS
jgi:hypothetical protein